MSRLFIENLIKPSDLTNTALNGISKLDKLNAFITVTDKEAQVHAEESNSRFSTKKSLSELDGIPVAIKDNFCTKDIKTTCGSKMLENFIPTYNATVYQRLADAGAVLIGKTNLDQFAMGSGTVDSIYGPTKNIWSLKHDNENFHIAGGSSGGSAAAVAAGICFA